MIIVINNILITSMPLVAELNIYTYIYVCTYEYPTN